MAAEVSDVDDKALMLRFQSRGNMTAFEELFRRHKTDLFRYLERLTRPQEIAEEISQHTWLKVIEVARSQNYTPVSDASFKTWLYTLARNHYVDAYVRAHAVSRTVVASQTVEQAAAHVEEPAGTDHVVELEQLGDLLDRAIERLPEEQRDVLLLWAHGHDLTAVAQIFGVPWATVVSRKKYAIAKLRTALAQAGVTQGDL